MKQQWRNSNFCPSSYLWWMKTWKVRVKELEFSLSSFYLHMDFFESGKGLLNIHKKFTHKTSPYLFRIEEEVSICSDSYWPFFSVWRYKAYYKVNTFSFKKQTAFCYSQGWTPEVESSGKHLGGVLKIKKSRNVFENEENYNMRGRAQHCWNTKQGARHPTPPSSIQVQVI